MTRKLVIIESPFAGDTEKNITYLYACLRDSLARGEAPLASHGFYPHFLDDSIPAERSMGMESGWAWMEAATRVAVYHDLGISKGMMLGIERASDLHKPITFRSLPGWAKP